jgi:hypothetical protein
MDASCVAREFKRRLGDETPLVVGGVAYRAEALTAKLLRWVVDAVQERQGGRPEQIAITHPANWGPHKQDLLRRAVQMAELQESGESPGGQESGEPVNGQFADCGVLMLTEPEAAAISYASTERVEPDEIVAVYDLGGGTFDAAVLRKTGGSFEILGLPQGIERLGGLDFDDAILASVDQALDGALGRLDLTDPVTVAAVARVRQECVEAKEALSSDVEVVIPVLLPGLQTHVQLTRAEFEEMIRPAISQTIEALRRALRSAGVTPDQVSVVLMVGGSSRIPLVAAMVSAELGRPVAVDAHPTHAIALGAVLAAVFSGVQAPAWPRASTPPPPQALPPGSYGARTVPPAPVANEPLESAAVYAPALALFRPVSPAAEPPSADRDGSGTGPLPSPPGVPGTVNVSAGEFLPPMEGGSELGGRRRGFRLPWTLISAGLLGLALAVVAMRMLGPPAPGGEPGARVSARAERALTARISGITVERDSYVVDWDSFGFTSALDGVHVHFFFNTVPPDQAGRPGHGPWWEHGPGRPFVGYRLIDRPPGATQICVLVAGPDHAVRPATGNCAPIP